MQQRTLNGTRCKRSPPTLGVQNLYRNTLNNSRGNSDEPEGCPWVIYAEKCVLKEKILYALIKTFPTLILLVCTISFKMPRFSHYYYLIAAAVKLRFESGRIKYSNTDIWGYILILSRNRVSVFTKIQCGTAPRVPKPYPTYLPHTLHISRVSYCRAGQYCAVLKRQHACHHHFIWTPLHGFHSIP